MRVRTIRRRAPFPDVAPQLQQSSLARRRRCRRGMQPTRGAQVALDRRHRLRCVFPFEFVRQARAGPRCECRGLVEADVANRSMRIECAPSAERVLALEVLRPAERPIPAALLDECPTVGEPKLRRCIAAVPDELAVLAVGDETICEEMRLEPLAVPRALVVESETRGIGTDLGESGRLE